VKVFDEEFEEEVEFKLVGSSEANSLQGKISNESPVGRALIGHTIGDVVDVETQAGVISYKVLEIQRSI
jgi:transcription elongation factor GreA